MESLAKDQRAVRDLGQTQSPPLARPAVSECLHAPSLNPANPTLIPRWFDDNAETVWPEPALRPTFLETKRHSSKYADASACTVHTQASTQVASSTDEQLFVAVDISWDSHSTQSLRTSLA